MLRVAWHGMAHGVRLPSLPTRDVSPPRPHPRPRPLFERSILRGNVTYRLAWHGMAWQAQSLPNPLILIQIYHKPSQMFTVTVTGTRVALLLTMTVELDFYSQCRVYLPTYLPTYTSKKEEEEERRSNPV